MIANDSINIPKNNGVVEVSGEVYIPGYVQWSGNSRISHYIDKAGGYKPDADKNNIMVIYPNGDIDIKKFLHKALFLFL